MLRRRYQQAQRQSILSDHHLGIRRSYRLAAKRIFSVTLLITPWSIIWSSRQVVANLVSALAFTLVYRRT